MPEALTALPGTDLTDYVLQLLGKHGIETVQDFIASDVDNVCKVTNLTRTSFAYIKSELLKKYGPKEAKMSQLYKRLMREPFSVYKTGIPDLDRILTSGVFSAGCLLEICGSPAIGKSQLCLTFTLNFVTNYDAEVLYIATRVKRTGTRIYQMLKARNVDKCEIGQILQRIKIKQTESAEGIISLLSELLSLLETDKISSVAKIKMVVIDSLPAVWMHLIAQETKRRANFLLTRLANLMRKLAKNYSMVFVFVNLMVRIEQKQRCLESGLLLAIEANIQASVSDKNRDSDDDDDGVSSQLSETDSSSSQLRPALGNYWSSVPTVRLLMECRSSNSNCNDDGDDAAIRVIRVLKSCYSKSGQTAIVRITDAGVE